MCGIFGYVGEEISVSSILKGLSRLEYRGYDSCGIAGIRQNKKSLFVKKKAGKISFLQKALKNSLKFSLCISHTRWATHGASTQKNAHPHLDCKKEIAVVHNGIIENYHQLKEKLLKEGHCFLSLTDTEVIAHLIEKYKKTMSFKEAVGKTVHLLRGSFAFAALSLKEDYMVVAKKDSPLILGLTERGNFVASDIPALLKFTKEVIYLEDGNIGLLYPDKIKISDFTGKTIKARPQRIKFSLQETHKDKYPHYMLKEIFQQQDILGNLFSLYAHGLGAVIPKLDKILNKISLNKILITGCGTAYHAGYAGKYLLEKYAGLNVEIDTSSEFRYRKFPLDKNTLLIAISQSGETADTLAAVREAKKKGATILSICNTLTSTLARESSIIIPTYAGIEVSVASTKAYTAQLFCVYILTLYLARVRRKISPKKYNSLIKELSHLSYYYRCIFNHLKKIKTTARKFAKFGSFLFLGRGINYPSALEGALKLKEISYIPAEGYPAGEMKHGPIALIDEYRAVVCITPQGLLYEKMLSNMQEIKARKGKILGLITEGDNCALKLCDEVVYLPRLKEEDISPLVVAPILQLFAYYVARTLGCEIDKPRNLAKSVTVE